MKSIRKEILASLAKHGQQTMDDLFSTTDGITRGQLSNNIQAARNDQLVERVRDDVTGLPAYKITKAGLQRLAEMSNKKGDSSEKTQAVNGANNHGSIASEPRVAGGPKRTESSAEGDATATVVRKSLTTEMPTDKECCNAAKVVAATAGAELAKARDALKLAEEQRDLHFETAEDYRDQLTLAQNALDTWAGLAEKHGCSGYHQLNQLITELKAASKEAVDVKDAAEKYVVQVPGKKVRVCTKPENARKAAIASARQHGSAQVYALVPVGKAVRAAEWRE